MLVGVPTQSKRVVVRCGRLGWLGRSGAIAPGVSIVRSLRVKGAQTLSACALMLTPQRLRDVLGCSAIMTCLRSEICFLQQSLVGAEL
jgi:hypothetical protein